MASVGSFIRRHILHSRYIRRVVKYARPTRHQVSVDTNRLDNIITLPSTFAAPRLYGGEVGLEPTLVLDIISSQSRSRISSLVATGSNRQDRSGFCPVRLSLNRTLDINVH
jgi:hypothetical protein